MFEWIYDGAEGNLDDLENWIGFVYIIENKVNHRKYIGKKLFWFSKTTTRKNPKTGKPKKTRSKVPSDWKEYYGSNKELQADVVEFGPANFSREILKLCKTKGEMSYVELKEQIFRGVLESNDYYNGIVQVKIHKKHVPK